MTVQKPTNMSPQKQMTLRCGLGKIRLYCSKKDTLITFIPKL